MLTACQANIFLTVSSLPVKWRCSRSNISNQSELGHDVLRVWKGYIRAFSYTKFCVIIQGIRWVAGKTSPHWENSETAKYVCFQCSTQSPLLAIRTSFATIIDVSGRPIHRLSYAVTIYVNCRSSCGEKWWQSPHLKPQTTSPVKNSNALQNAASSSFDMKFACEKALVAGFYTLNPLVNCRFGCWVIAPRRSPGLRP